MERGEEVLDGWGGMRRCWMRGEVVVWMTMQVSEPARDNNVGLRAWVGLPVREIFRRTPWIR